MGLLELRGKFTSGMRLLETFGEKVATETSVFDGLDTSIKGIAKLTNNSEETFTKKTFRFTGNGGKGSEKL